MSTQSESKVTQEAWVITKGDLTIDFGDGNQQIAWEFEQLLRNPQVRITYKGERL